MSVTTLQNITSQSDMTKLLRLYAVLTVYLAIEIITLSSALKGGYEDLHIYDYKAEISVGVEEPGEYVSKYSLQGLIKVQRDIKQLSVSQHDYLISLTNFKHDSYYGEDTIRINKYKPIDEQLLGNAFTAIYKPNGQLKSTVFKKNETQWSKQIKVAIARLLQFDWSGSRKDLNKEGQMHFAPVEEISIHGKCFVNYNSTLINNSKTNKKINLVKIIYPTQCNNFVRNFSGYGINDKASIDEIKTRLDHKKTNINTVYELKIIKNQPIVKKIFNFERYRIGCESNVYVFNHNPQFVKVRQTLFLKNTEPGHEFLQNSEKIVTSNNNQNVKLNQEQVISKVKELLVEVNQFMNEHQLIDIKPGVEYRQPFNRIHHYLKYLDINSFEKLYNEIKILDMGNARQVLAQIIPFVGTKSGLSFIKTMIMEKKVSDAEAIYLISTVEKFQNPDDILPELEIFLKKNNGLSPKVQQAAVHSFSCLVSKICMNSPNSNDVSMEKYIQSIDALLKDATIMDAKLAYLTALGNTQCHGALKYIKTVLSRKKNDSNDQVRLRMVAIWILMRLVDANDTDVLDELTKILYDENEMNKLRLSAYKVLVHKGDFDTDDLIEIGRKISKNEYLQNYHLTTMRNLNQIGILSDDALSKIESKTAELSSLLMTNVVIHLDDYHKLKFIESYFKPKNKFARIIVLGNFQEALMISAPTLVEFEAFDVVDGTIIVDHAIYCHNNLYAFINDDEKNEDEALFADFLDFRDDRNTFNSFELSRQNINNFDIEQFLKDMVESMMKPWFLYNNLETFAIPTGFGIDAVYQIKRPSLLNIKSSYNLSMTLDYAKVQMKFSYDYWFHGYSDLSFNNPITQLKYSTRKTHITEITSAAEFHCKYDFSKQTFELIIPLVSRDPQFIMKIILSSYISNSVMITDHDDEFSCPICGYQYTTKSDSMKPMIGSEDPTFKPLGLSNQLIYNCDKTERLRFMEINNLDQRYSNIIVSSCGVIRVIESDASVSQIEFLVDVDEFKLIRSTSSPWYFLPGFELNIDAYLGIRKSLNNDLTTLGKINMIFSNSQGHFLNEGRFRLTVRLDDDKNFNVCLNVKNSFPNVTDTQLPSKVTNLNVFYEMHMSFGEFKDEFCSTGAKYSFETRLTGVIPQDYLDELKRHSRNSKCATQMKNSLFVYPSGSYLMTKNCISELISKTSVRRFIIDYKSDQMEIATLVIIFHTIEQMKQNIKEKIFNRYKLDVDVKSLSQIHDIVSNKTISFQMDVKDHYSKMALSLPNFYFSADFLLNFINNHYKVINVYPKLVLFNNKERKDLVDRLKDWTFIVGDDEKPSYKIYVKLLEDDKLMLKLLHNFQQLRLEPSMKKGDSSSRIFYNEYIDDFSERTFLKSDEDILFSLLKVDGYLVVHPTEIPIIIYYYDNSVTILQENFLGS